MLPPPKMPNRDCRQTVQMGNWAGKEPVDKFSVSFGFGMLYMDDATAEVMTESRTRDLQTK